MMNINKDLIFTMYGAGIGLYILRLIPQYIMMILNTLLVKSITIDNRNNDDAFTAISNFVIPKLKSKKHVLIDVNADGEAIETLGRGVRYFFYNGRIVVYNRTLHEGSLLAVIVDVFMRL